MNKVKTSLIKKIFSTAASVAVLSASIIPASLAVATPVYAAPNLSITNVVDKDLADRGETLSYTVTVKAEIDGLTIATTQDFILTIK